MDKSVKFRIELETKGQDTLRSIKVNADDFRTAVKNATEEVKNLDGTLDRIAKSGLIFSAVKDAVESLQSAIGGLANNYDSFDKGMRAANTMAKQGKEGFSTLKEEVRDLSEVIPLLPEELANGLYQVVSNGVPKDNWISFLERSGRSAVGGIADLGQTVTVTSTIIKNYGLEWSAVADIQDKIQTTAQNGVTSFEQLSAALPRVTGNAATLGVTIDELMASFATLTGVSGNTAEVSTQLAAIFTALVKPSSEAAEMAGQMGIRFDAAAIKAAGGMRNFLVSLTQSVEQYAASSGMLEQEIYGRLFGSAEALRALIPITGELADKYDQNVEAMANSTGAIDQAFEQMSGSGESVNQMLKNQFAAFTEWAGSVAASIQPYLSFVVTGGQAIYGLALMGTALKKAAAGVMALTAVQKKNVVVSTLAAMHEKIQSFALNMLTASSLTATAGTWALTAAVTALYAAATLGLSLVITGLVSLFADTGDEAEQAAEKVDIFKESTEAFTRVASDTKAELDMELVSLRNLIKGQGDESEAIKKLNTRYGDAFGYHKTAADWYDTLVRKSQLYCTQLGYEAQAKVLASQIAAKEMERDEKRSTWMQQGQQYLDRYGKAKFGYEMPGGIGQESYLKLGQEVEQLNSDIIGLKGRYDNAITKMGEASKKLAEDMAKTTVAIDWQKMSYEQLGKAVDKQKSKVASLAGVNETEAKKEAALLKKMETRYNTLGKKFGLSSSASGSKSREKDKYSGKKLIENAQSYKELGNNITYYQNQLELTDKTETQTIATLQKKINALKEEQAEIKRISGEAGRPEELDTLEKIDSEIAYQQALRKKATAENIAGIDAEINHLNGLKIALESGAHSPLTIEQIETYEQLEREIGYYEAALKRATVTERAEIQLQINALRGLREEWDSTLSALDVPEDIGKLNTIEQLSEAIGYYDDRIKKASAGEIEALQRTKMLLEGKAEALKRLTELPAMQDELADLGGLDSKSLKMELELIGLEGVRDKIRSLQRMLDDTKNPLDAGQRKEVNRLIASWSVYEGKLQRSKVTFKGTWGAMRGAGDGIIQMTEALRGNGNAWEKVTGVMDGMIGLYDSISGIVGIIRAMTVTTHAHTAAKTAEAAATVTATTAQGVEAGMAETQAAAQIPVIVANKLATASFLELAAASYFAAHAYIPFAGFGIAAGFVAASVAMTKGIGAMPFANGGVIYGPTLGLMGEYAGASNNPEVVAPLDKLRGLIQPVDAFGGGGTVEFKIKGRSLVGIYNRETNLKNRT